MTDVNCKEASSSPQNNGTKSEQQVVAAVVEETNIAVNNSKAATKAGSIPLHGTWTIWFDNPRLAPAGSDWKENLKMCATFSTIEDFWRAYNNLRPPTQIGLNSNYSIFRHGIEPTWEHPENCEGGKFVLTVTKKDSKSGKCDEWWLDTVLAVIGETMDQTGDQVNGAVVSIRKNMDRIALWIKCSDKETCVAIGERWKKALHLEKTTLRYQMHKDAAESGRSFRNEVHFEV